MAKLETIVRDESFDALLERIEQGILKGSFSATLEDSSDFGSEDCRCAVRVFERYSMLGSNRVSLNVTLFQGPDGIIHVSGITSGGSQSAFLKINTFVEQAFLDKLDEIL